MAGDGPRIEYIEARRVLLDALTALVPHLDAVVLVAPKPSTFAPMAASRATSPLPPTPTSSSTPASSVRSRRSAT